MLVPILVSVGLSIGVIVQLREWGFKPRRLLYGILGGGAIALALGLLLLLIMTGGCETTSTPAEISNVEILIPMVDNVYVRLTNGTFSYQTAKSVYSGCDPKAVTIIYDNDKEPCVCQVSYKFASEAVAWCCGSQGGLPKTTIFIPEGGLK